MWLLFGTVAIVTAVLNIVWMVRKRETKYFRFISLSSTALTVCAFYTQANQWLLREDWSALMDVMPAVARILWVLIIVSLAVNSVSLFKN